MSIAKGERLSAMNFSDEENARIQYYCKLSEDFSLRSVTMLRDISLINKTGYAYDLYIIINRYFDRVGFSILFGDITHVPNHPTFVKSRPININNVNSVLLPLNTFRHLVFLKDKIDFSEKISKIVWRGASYHQNRKDLLKCVEGLEFCDFKDTSRHAPGGGRVNWMSMAEQLKYKFIFSIEGNDVATNLKWIMSSNSVCFMPRPKYETWFMEGSLIPGIHYVLIEDDFSNVESQYEYYMKNPGEAIRIIRNAHAHVEKFKDLNRQYVIARGVVAKYHSLQIRDGSI